METWVDEGIDYLMDMVFKETGTPPANLYLGLFSSQTASTVPARTATGGAVPVGWTEVTGTGYARIAVTSANWGAASTSGSSRKITSAQKTYTAGGVWDAANGFFLATASASGVGDIILAFANFDSGLARTLAISGDQLKLTPSVLMSI